MAPINIPPGNPPPSISAIAVGGHLPLGLYLLWVSVSGIFGKSGFCRLGFTGWVIGVVSMGRLSLEPTRFLFLQNRVIDFADKI